MKRLAFIVIGSLIIFALMYRNLQLFKQIPERNEKPKAVLKIDSTAIHVGGVYQICCCREVLPMDNNPFEKQDAAFSRATVLIVDSIDNYVQYIWAHDSGRLAPTKFSRSVPAFKELMRECK